MHSDVSTSVSACPKMKIKTKAAHPHQYQPLQPGQIRLLRLYPPVVQKMTNTFCRVFFETYKNNPPLHDRLIVVNLDDCDSVVRPGFAFQAVSYVWGSNKRLHYLQLLDGQLRLTTSPYPLLSRMHSWIACTHGSKSARPP